MNNILRSIGNFFKRLFSNGQLKRYAVAAVRVVQIIKTALDSPVTELIVKLTPTSLDDWALAKAKVILPKVVASTKLAADFEGRNVSDIVEFIMGQLKIIDPSDRALVYNVIGAGVLHALADGRLDFKEAMKIVEDTYQELKRVYGPDWPKQLKNDQ